MLTVLLSAVLALPLAAQDERVDPSQPDSPGLEEPLPEKAGPIDLEDARFNFGGIVQAFIDQRSPEGFWPLRDKNAGRTRRLKLVSIDEKGVKPVGSSRFAGPVVLKDIRNGKLLPAIFTVDFSGPEWKVVRMRLPSK